MTARQTEKKSRWEKLVTALPVVAFVVGVVLVALVVVKTNELLNTYYAIRLGRGWINVFGIMACVVIATTLGAILWLNQSDKYGSHKEP